MRRLHQQAPRWPFVIDETHPHAHGLVMAVPLWHGMLNDVSPYRRAVTVNGTPVWRPVDQHLAIDPNAAHDLSLGDIGALSAFTVSCWIRYETATDAYNAAISKGEVFAGTGRQFSFGTRYRAASVEHRIYCYGRVSSAIVGGESSRALVIGRTHHICASWAPGALRLYVDGVQVGSAANGPGTYAGSELRVGRPQGLTSADARFSDPLWDARLYDYAMSAAEVRSLYDQRWSLFAEQGRRTRFPAPAAPVGGAVGGVLWSGIFRPGARVAA